MPIPVGLLVAPPETPTDTTILGPSQEPAPPRVVKPALTGFGVSLERAGHPTIVLAEKAISSGWKVLTGAQGLDLPPVQHFSAPIPDGYGDVHLGSRFGTREPFLRIGVNEDTYEDTRGRMRALWAMVGDLQPFDLVVRQLDGGSRRVLVRYVSGLEGSYTDSDWWVNRRHIGLTMIALDPLAYGDEASQTWMVTGAARPFLSTTEAFFPVVLGDSLVGGERTLTNSGELDAWPVTTVTGPGSGLTLQNLTTGKSFTLTGTITEPLTIDARRVVADVYDTKGDLWNRVSLGSSLFPLVKGENKIKVTLTGADANSKVSMRWSPPYRSLH